MNKTMWVFLQIHKKCSEVFHPTLLKKVGKIKIKKIRRDFFISDIGNSEKVTANLLLSKFSAVIQ